MSVWSAEGVIPICNLSNLRLPAKIMKATHFHTRTFHEMEQTLSAYTRAERCRVAAFAFAAASNLAHHVGSNTRKLLIHLCANVWLLGRHAQMPR